MKYGLFVSLHFHVVVILLVNGLNERSYTSLCNFHRVCFSEDSWFFFRVVFLKRINVNDVILLMVNEFLSTRSYQLLSTDE
jgi:hypothetical protein